MSSPSDTAETPEVELFSGDGKEWDAALDSLSGGSFCHLYGWRAVMERALGHETWWWVARGGDGAVRGLLPLVRVRSRLFGDYLVSMPFLNYGGPLGDDAAIAALTEKAVAEAGRLGVDLLELRTRHGFPTELTVSDRKITVTKELPDDPEFLWEKGIKAKVRSQIRRPMKEGLESRLGADQAERFYEIFAHTMRDLGTPVLPWKLFREIRDNFGDAVVFAVVERDGVAMAAGCGFHFGGEFEITWAGALREHSRIAPNMLLYWAMMEDSVKRGARVFNFGRCTPGSGTHRFKKQWGTEDEPLPWAQWSPTGVLATPNPDSPKFRAAVSAWQKLPLGVANRLGPFLSRSLP